MRERAQQPCPCCRNPVGAGRRELDVGVGEDDVGAPAAQLERDPLDLLGTPAMTWRPTSVEPRAVLAYGRLVDEALGDELPPGRICSTPWAAGLERQLPMRSVLERRQLGRLEHHGVAGGERRCEPHPAIAMGVPGHDDADHSERLVEGDVEAAGTGICRPLWRSGAPGRTR